ncbi:sensor histidine kinase [Rubrivirga marina]|uniref:Histidine kinase n=1 Tax=Rubrivirga marina TaxID=1196024 RepID=A0A271IY93_9BACT|nr:sensor histidine kinase [Rubrivirga marina]PAP76100.1 hypothetical protein BSZ37_06400 [Rubrivirga marina]
MDRLSDTNANPRLSAEVLERALHATDIMVVLTDPHLEDNPIIWVNDYFCQFTGYGRDEVLGRNCRFLQGDDRDQPAIRRLRRAIDAGESVNVHIRNYRKDGSPFDNDLYVSPVRETPSDLDGPIRYFIGVQNDSTARIRAEAEVADRTREVHETAENERERFGMDLHDGLGQELAGVGLLLKALVGRLEDEGSASGALAGRVLDLVEEALSSARDMARGLNPVDASPYGLGDALRTLCDRVAESQPDIEVRARVEPIPFDDRREARHLYRIAQEALSNAVKHAEASQVLVTLHRTGGSVHLEVRDDGAGVPEELTEVGDAVPVQDRAELARRGMGLYGMRYRADLIGAALTVRRDDGGGTVVRCVVPDAASGPRAGHRARSGERE